MESYEEPLGEIRLNSWEAKILMEALQKTMRSVPEDLRPMAEALLHEVTAIYQAPPPPPRRGPAGDINAVITRMEVEVVGHRVMSPYTDLEDIAELIVAGAAFGRIKTMHVSSVHGRNDIAAVMKKMGKDPELVLGAYWDMEEL